MFGKVAGGEARAKRKPHQWTKTVCRQRPDEVQAVNRRFEVRGQHGYVIDVAQLRGHTGVQERESSQIEPITCGGDDVIGADQACSAITGCDPETDAAVALFGESEAATQKQWYFTYHQIPYEPSARRSQVIAHHAQAQT